MADGIYLGLDLSTQQLKGIVVDSRLQQVELAKVEFEVDLPEYKTIKGVYTNSATKEVLAPVSMWLEALDLLFARLKKTVDFSKLVGVSGACQQHGSVYWNKQAPEALKDLGASGPTQSLKDQLGNCFAWEMSPNWQDHSTESECKDFEKCVGGPKQLAGITGSKAHHRFTGPQILKVKHQMPKVYEATDRIALVSSFLASVLGGEYVDIDVSDACGMNLWDVEKREVSAQLMALFGDVDGIKQRLGSINEEGDVVVSRVSKYFVDKYGVNEKCGIVAFTGDNPGTILSLPLKPNDVIVSLGTSTTALVVTHNYVPSPLYHMFAHPVSKGAYMGMLCYCNGSLAREKVRDEVNGDQEPSKSWDRFNQIAEDAMNAGTVLGNKRQLGFFFPLAEIIPSVDACQIRLTWDSDLKEVSRSDKWADSPEADVLGILESQALSVRHRLTPMLSTADGHPRRVYFVGGASQNEVICRALGRVLMPSEGAFRVQDMNNACAFGAAAKAVYGSFAKEQEGSTWEEFLEERSSDEKFVGVKSGDEDGRDLYKEAVAVFVASEKACFKESV